MSDYQEPQNEQVDFSEYELVDHTSLHDIIKSISENFAHAQEEVFDVLYNAGLVTEKPEEERLLGGYFSKEEIETLRSNINPTMRIVDILNIKKSIENYGLDATKAKSLTKALNSLARGRSVHWEEPLINFFKMDLWERKLKETRNLGDTLIRCLVDLRGILMQES